MNSYFNHKHYILYRYYQFRCLLDFLFIMNQLNIELPKIDGVSDRFLPQIHKLRVKEEKSRAEVFREFEKKGLTVQKLRIFETRVNEPN